MVCNSCGESTNPVDAPDGFCSTCKEWAKNAIAGLTQIMDAADAKCNPCDPERPYDGQPHTDQGERGRTEVRGLTMRDICDCFIMGWLDASERGHLIVANACDYGDVYTDYDIDPLAVKQNMICWIEKKMGIWPNVPTMRETP